MKFPDKCFHGKFILAEFSSLQHSVVSQTQLQREAAAEPSGSVVQTDREEGLSEGHPAKGTWDSSTHELGDK